MHAIIRLGDGKYYLSQVFGYYCPITATEKMEVYRQRIYSQYYLVLDSQKQRLQRQYVFDAAKVYLIPSLIIVDTDQSDWKMMDDEQGCVSFLADLPADEVERDLPAPLLQRCIEADRAYQFEPYPRIRTQRDIDNLLWATGSFHDAFIKTHQIQPDGSLYVLLEGVWGCSVELWFSGDVSYCTKSYESELYDPYWCGASVFWRDGWLYLVDDLPSQDAEIDDSYCWFRAKQIKYHIIPL